jgi:hypothetical protein
MMIRTILVTAAALASVSYSPGYAESAQAPWCAVIELDPSTVFWDCQYHSFDASEAPPQLWGGTDE